MCSSVYVYVRLIMSTSMLGHRSVIGDICEWQFLGMDQTQPVTSPVPVLTLQIYTYLRRRLNKRRIFFTFVGNRKCSSVSFSILHLYFQSFASSIISMFYFLPQKILINFNS